MAAKMKKQIQENRCELPSGSQQDLLRIAQEYRRRFGKRALSQLDTPSFIRAAFGTRAR